jgi:plasmid stabilization system protein ParE
MIYNITFNAKAVRDIESSFEWGVNNWGEEQAVKWLRDLHSAVRRRLSESPLSCPVAPESSARGHEVRQLLYGRYRILFTIRKNEVRVIHLRGPYHEK